MRKERNDHRTGSSTTIFTPIQVDLSGTTAKAFGIDRQNFRMTIRTLLFVLALASLPVAKLAATPEEEETTPYFGDWENDRGDTLQITKDTIKVNDEKPARYDDITEDSDESFFVLQIKDSSEASYFGGNFLRITFGKDPDHFSMSVYKTLPDTLKKENEVKHIEWSAPAVEEEEMEETPQPKEEQPAGEQKKDEEKKSDQPKADQSAEKPTPSPSATPTPAPLLSALHNANRIRRTIVSQLLTNFRLNIPEITLWP